MYNLRLQAENANGNIVEETNAKRTAINYSIVKCDEYSFVMEGKGD